VYTCTCTVTEGQELFYFYPTVRTRVQLYTTCTRTLRVQYESMIRCTKVPRYIFDMICIIQIGLRESYVYTYCTVRITTRMYFMISYEYFMYVAQQYNTYLRTYVV
jgi:hypothetical protein